MKPCIMGIPFYFRYLMKNHPKMLQSVAPRRVDTLYLDSNSIVYDAFYAITASLSSLSSLMSDKELEKTLIDAVIAKIRHYIARVGPARAFVAFDGVAPLSKMDQQRARRHKHLFQPDLPGWSGKVPAKGWNTNAITPGTRFMTDLSQSLHRAFKNAGNVVLSTSDEPGEGEHKLFADMRARQLDASIQGDQVVYGLDADLIMLSLLHLPTGGVGVQNNLWIFREAPHFRDSKQKVDKNVTKGAADDEEECLHLDVRMLGQCILQEMNCGTSDPRRLHDYVFLCFFLGNDFLPHFPCLNIRTHGMPSLIAIYKDVLRKGSYLVDLKAGRVEWANLKLWIQRCASLEPEWFVQERDARDKMARSCIRQIDPKDPMTLVDQAPLLFRGEEHYIDAGITPGWQQRYYAALFPTGSRNERAERGEKAEKVDVQSVCREYLQGLEWVFQYYTRGCTDWGWRYTHTYAPLMADLCRFFEIPTGTSVKPGSGVKGPVKPWVQLAYVLPMENHAALIPDQAKVALLKTRYSHVYVDRVHHFDWSFCRYFWEAHPRLPVIPIATVLDWSSED